MMKPKDEEEPGVERRWLEENPTHRGMSSAKALAWEGPGASETEKQLVGLNGTEWPERSCKARQGRPRWGL